MNTLRDASEVAAMQVAAPSRSHREWLGWGRLALTIVANVYLLLALGLVAIATIPMLLGWQASVVQSGSMEPHIRPGDVVLTSALPAGQPVPLGRVVAFHSDASAEASGEGRIRLHRIVADNGDGTFQTQGDANADPDSDPLDPGQIIGQGRLLIPAIGLPSLWIGHGDYAPIAIWGGATLLAFLLVVTDGPAARRR